MGALTLQRLNLLENCKEFLAEVGEAILDMKRNLCELCLLKDAMRYKFAQALIQDFGGDARNSSLKLTRPLGASVHRTQDAP